MIHALMQRKPITLPLIGVGLAVVLGIVLGSFGWLGVAAVVGLMLAVMVWLWPETAFIASLATLVIGQLIRVPISGGENSVIINDLLLPPLIFVWTLRRLSSRHWNIPSSSLTLPILAVTILMGLSLLVNRHLVISHDWLLGALYAVRWVMYLAVLVMGYEYVRTHQRALAYVHGLIWTGVAVSILGFLQLRIFPDFSFMVPQGWDPHVGRLLSTWFDPNFLAGYLVLLVTVTLSMALARPIIQARWYWTAIAIMLVAIVFTFSRSGYVALAAGAGLVTVVRARALFFLGLIGFLAVVMFVPRVQERVVGIRTIDETAQLRIVSWTNAWSVITEHPWLGVGYNVYRYVQVQSGFLDDPQEHSASGSDSSFLTVWVTTGIFGLLAYLWLFGAILREAWRTWRDRSLPPVWSGFGLGLLAGLLALFVHSQFVNSLLYPHIMQVLWLLVAIVIMVRQPEKT